jgi:hypothetical protein
LLRYKKYCGGLATMFRLFVIYGCMIILLSVCSEVFAAEKASCKVLDKDIADSYEGECLNGLANGKGKARGKDSYEGFFYKGLEQGEGVYRWASGDVYSGEWKEGKRTGWGKLTLPNGATYEGEWKEDVCDGNGSYNWPNGAYYEGGWKNNKRDGTGVYYGSDKAYYKGEWKEGRQHGKGFYQLPNGISLEGLWENGVFVKEARKTIEISLDRKIYDFIEEERNKTGESASDIVTRAVLRLMEGNKVSK